MFRLDSLSKLLANCSPDIRANVLYLWNIEKAIFTLEKAGCVSYFAGKYRSIVFCSIPPIIVGKHNTFYETRYLKEQKHSQPKKLKLRQLLGVA